MTDWVAWLQERVNRQAEGGEYAEPLRTQLADALTTEIARWN